MLQYLAQCTDAMHPYMEDSLCTLHDTDSPAVFCNALYMTPHTFPQHLGTRNSKGDVQAAWSWACSPAPHQYPSPTPSQPQGACIHRHCPVMTPPYQGYLGCRLAPHAWDSSRQIPWGHMYVNVS